MGYRIYNIDIPGYAKCYDHALADWEKAGRWRGFDDTDERKLNRKSSGRHMGLTLRDNGDIAFRLYNTDVVIWHPEVNGVASVTIEPYASLATHRFIQAYGPNCLIPSFLKRGNHSRDMVMSTHVGAWKQQKLFKMTGDPVRWEFIGDRWEPVPGPGLGKFEVSKIDRRAARAACLKHGFKDVEGFVWAACLTTGYKQGTPRPSKGEPAYMTVARDLRDSYYGAHRIVNLLKDRSLWPALVYASDLLPEDNEFRAKWGRRCRYTPETHARKITAAVRRAIYNVEDVVHTIEVDHFTSFAQMAAAGRTNAGYGC